MSEDKFIQLFELLDAQLHLHDCDHDLKLTEQILVNLGVKDILSVLAWLKEQGGYCDCEVMMNVEQKFEYLEKNQHKKVVDMKQNDIEIQIGKFEKNKTSIYHRYYSFDFCYNYFFKKQNSGIDLEKDCLQLGYYLASWGMLRGSSFLLQTNLAHYKKVIEFINNLDEKDWDIDIENYGNNLDRIVDIYNGIKDCIMPPKADNNHLVLVSKIMLGTLGIVPAYDRYVSQSIKNIYNGDKFNINTLNTTKNFNKKYKESLEFLNKFYNANKVDFDTVSIYTKEFGSEKDSKLQYTKAKILDMYLFAKGLL